MKEQLLRKGWILFSPSRDIYFREGCFMMLDGNKIIDMWYATVFYKVK